MDSLELEIYADSDNDFCCYVTPSDNHKRKIPLQTFFNIENALPAGQRSGNVILDFKESFDNSEDYLTKLIRIFTH